MDHKHYLVVYRTGKGVVFSATEMKVVKEDRAYAVFYSYDDVFALVPLDEIKTILCGADSASELIEAIIGMENNDAES